MFDLCIGNPAFNISQSGNVAGTGGNTTLYKKAIRYDFFNRVKPNGTLVNIALKGIISDLITGVYKDYQIDWIYLMDDIDVWPYNTCAFSITKTKRYTDPVIIGGMAKGIFSYKNEDLFPMVYYSGSDNGMRQKFNKSFTNKVIRRLPGKHNNGPIYDFTNNHILSGPKFAFSVLESKKSYYVTDEPIFGGTICYIPTATIEEAEKLKLFTEVNPVFQSYTSRMRSRGHAFSLRSVKRFDLNQINTGNEIPVEWMIQHIPQTNIIDNECELDINNKKSAGEVFTPMALVNIILDMIELTHPTLFKEPNNRIIDTMCGNGQFIIGVINRLIKNGILKPFNQVYGIDLSSDNILALHSRLNNEYGPVNIRNMVNGDMFQTLMV